MNFIFISNIFNLIAQQLGFKGYHWGYESDINRNVQNNFNPQNSIGNQYPFVLVEKPIVVSKFVDAIESTAQMRVNFFAPQNYNNDAGTNVLPTIEQENALRVLAYAFVNSINTTGTADQLSGLQKFQIVNNTVNFEHLESQGKDRLIQIVATFTLKIIEQCPAVVFDPTAVVAPYAFPPSDASDYELINAY